MPETEATIVTVRVVGTGAALHGADLTGWDLGPDDPPAEATADLGQGLQRVTVVARGSLTRAGAVGRGPAIITQPESTGLLLPGDTGTVDAAGNLVIRWEASS